MHALLLAAAISCPSCLETPQHYVSDYIAEIDPKGGIKVEGLDIQGQWYVYGDAYGNPKSCMDAGGHPEEVCSKVTYPQRHLPQLGFPNNGERVCVSGKVAEILECCVPDSEGNLRASCTKENVTNCEKHGEFDTSSMWGAGIGFDFDLDVSDDAIRNYELIHNREPWNASKYKIVGISFMLDWHPFAGENNDDIPMRIGLPVYFEEAVPIPCDKGTVILDDKNEVRYLKPNSSLSEDCDLTEPPSECPFSELPEDCSLIELPPKSSSEEHSYGSPFWRKDPDAWGRSPVVQGRNAFFWDQVHRPRDVEGPEEVYPMSNPFKGDNLLGLQFHVIPEEDGKGATPFSFCISDIQFLTDGDNDREDGDNDRDE